MTDAIASKNITENNATIIIEQNINIAQNDKQIFVLQNNVSCNCNETTDLEQNAQLQCNDNTTAGANRVDCYNKTVDNEVKSNKTEDKSGNNDTILKYVYKKNENNDSKKLKGHYKNSLRRKRSPTDSQLAQNAPLIVNYETSHTPVKDREQWLPAKQTANIIKSSDLADFNIETLHESVEGEKLQNTNRADLANFNIETLHESVDGGKLQNKHARSDNDDREQEQSAEISDRDRNENKRDSKVSNEEINESKSQERDDSNENNPNSNENSREDVNNSNESDRNNDRSTENKSREIDNDDEPKSDNLEFTKSRSEGSTENSEEVVENKSSRGNHHRSPHQIQSVDLDDFSYERIQLNKKGEVESARDAHGNEDVEIIPTLKPQPFIETHDEKKVEPYQSSDSSSKEVNEHTHIDDGEVKPVVEINSEAGSTESNEENSDFNNENESLETLTGVKEDSNEKYDKLQEKKRFQDVGDVKQQFERVPLNYNHESQKQAKSKDSEQDKHSENSEDEGTVDKLAPKNVRYDENLNVKFDDIAIKLPDIKLPEDILSYPYEDPPVYDSKEVKKKPVFFHYNSEEDEEEKREGSNHDENDDHVSEQQNTDDSEHQNDADNDYYGYYGNTKKQQAYKKHKNEVKEKDLYLEDDPYERFVRERFGKRDTFKKRSEKLRDLGAHNPELYRKVQNILEKTKNVNKEAAKSGDPNAGYMWALEYGEKL